MKKNFVCLLTLFASVGLFAQQQYTVAVTPFELVGGFTKSDADVIYELFITELGRTKGIKVVDRGSFDKIMSQMQFEISDWSDSKKVTEFGKALNANCIIRGQLMTLSGKLIISARVVDINTTEILSAAPMQLNNIGEFFDLLPAYVAEVVKQITTTATPPKSSDTTSGYKIRDKGPGGGTVFFAEGGQYMEYSGLLGKSNWKEAVDVARNFRGGGFSNWHLPTRREIQLIAIWGSYWTSEDSGAGLGNAWVYDSGSFWSREKKSSRHIIAVRSFSR